MAMKMRSVMNARKAMKCLLLWGLAFSSIAVVGKKRTIESCEASSEYAPPWACENAFNGILLRLGNFI